MEQSYKLRCSLHGHSSDIRAVASTIIPENGLVTCSRDKLCMIWSPLSTDGGEEGYELTLSLKGHTNYVSSVCIVPPSDTYTSGLIATGGHDCTIKLFHPTTGQCIHVLEGHTSTVSALAAGKFGTLLSGSWDKTAKVWLKDKCVMTLTGHTAAVWAVAIMPQQGYMLTGSADKSICMWKAGICEKTFTGHDDCVRGLAVVTATDFLSCSNDATIRRWNIHTGCINVYYGHTNYVYGIAMLPNGVDFITCAEDRTVKVWEGGENIQTITLPSQSVWSVCCLCNGDIVAATSDGKARIFTRCTERVANSEELAAFKQELASSTSTDDTLGGVKISDLPGEEALLAPGSRDGQTKLVRTADNTAVVYQWSVSEQQWDNVGQAVGASGGTAATSGKTLYNGKGKPPLKLPYNSTEDPWVAAHKFLMDNQLNAQFLDQVANFITQNSTQSVTTTTHSTHTASDPYTGGSRYIPGTTSSTTTTPSTTPNPAGHSDPLTGGLRYIPGVSGSTLSTPSNSAGDINPYFPVSKYVGFESSNADGITGKLKEFSDYVDADLMVKEEDWPIIQCFTSTTDNAPVERPGLEVLRKILKWPIDKLYPALDVLRLCIRNPHVAVVFANPTDLYNLTQAGCVQTPLHNQMLVLRVLSNLFLSDVGRDFSLQNSDAIVEHVAIEMKSSTNRNVRIGVATVLLNYAISGCRVSCDYTEDVKLSILIHIGECIRSETFNEALFRLIAALGTLMCDSAVYIAAAQSLDLKSTISKLTQLTEPVKLIECARMVANML